MLLQPGPGIGAITTWRWRRSSWTRSARPGDAGQGAAEVRAELRAGVLHRRWPTAGRKAYAEALRHFVAAEVIAKATDPSQLNEGFYFQLGAACERKGDYAQAEQYFEKSLKLAPDFAEAMNYLGYMWAEHGMKLGQARELIEKAVKAEPKNAAFLDSLAWVLFKLDQPQGGAALRPQGGRVVRAARRDAVSITWATFTRR